MEDSGCSQFAVCVEGWFRYPGEVLNTPNLDGKTLESRRKKLRRDFLLHLPLLINHSVSPVQARGATNRRLFLLPWIFGCRWQLQHRCLLAFYEGRQKNDFAIWKFQRIVMGGPPVLVDLSEDRGPVAYHRFVPWAQPVGPSPNFVREGQLSTRKQTNCHPHIFGCAEAPCAQIEHAGG
jgi:hypothetical protein